MVGLAVLAGVAIYIAVFWFLVRALKRKWAKGFAILVALAIPFWDLPVGYYNFYSQCARDSGLQVAKNLSPSESILIDSSAGFTPEEASRFGFKVVEYESGGQILRYTKDGNRLSRSTHATPVSRFKIQLTDNELLDWHLVRSTYFATRLDSKETVARQVTYRWLGMWWQAAAGTFFGSGTECGVSQAPSIMYVVAHGN